MGQVVKCPDCKTEVELPDVLKAGKKYLCPDCDTRLPTPAKKPTRPVLAEDDEEDVRPSKKVKSRRVEDEDEAPPARRPKKRRDEDEEDDRPRKKKRKGKGGSEDKPFWKTKMGKILSGLGFIAIGIILIAFALLTDSGKTLKYILGGILAILVGLGGLGYGIFSSDDDEEDEDSDEEDDSGGDDD